MIMRRYLVLAMLSSCLLACEPRRGESLADRADDEEPTLETVEACGDLPTAGLPGGEGLVEECDEASGAAPAPGDDGAETGSGATPQTQATTPVTGRSADSEPDEETPLPPPPDPAVIEAGPTVLRLLAVDGETPASRRLHYLERSVGGEGPWRVAPIPIAEKSAVLTSVARLARTLEHGLIVAYQAIFVRDLGAPVAALGAAVERDATFRSQRQRDAPTWPAAGSGASLALGKAGTGVEISDDRTTLRLVRVAGTPLAYAVETLAQAAPAQVFASAAGATDAGGNLAYAYVLRTSHGGRTSDSLSMRGPGQSVAALVPGGESCREIEGLAVAAIDARRTAASYTCATQDGNCRVFLTLAQDARFLTTEVGVAETHAACAPFHAARTALAVDATGTAHVAYRQRNAAYPGQSDIVFTSVRLGETLTPGAVHGALGDWSPTTGAPLLAVDARDRVFLVYAGAQGLRFAALTPDTPVPTTTAIEGVGGAMLEPVDLIVEGAGE